MLQHALQQTSGQRWFRVILLNISNTGKNVGTKIEGRAEYPYDNGEVYIIGMYVNFACNYLCNIWTVTSYNCGYSGESFLFSLLMIFLHELPLQACSSPMPTIRIWSIKMCP